MKFEDYEELGKLLKKAREVMFHQLHQPHEARWLKSKPFFKRWEKAMKNIDSAICILDDLMFAEYPPEHNSDKARQMLHIFYGPFESEENKAP